MLLKCAERIDDASREAVLAWQEWENYRTPTTHEVWRGKMRELEALLNADQSASGEVTASYEEV